MNIITGYRGEPHITSQQKRNTNVGIFGVTPRIVKGVGSELAATIVSANSITIADGMVVCQGCTAEITRGTSESITIENGEQGMLRTDLIVVRYFKNSGTGVEDMQLAVIKGTPSANDPATPAHTTGLIADGDSPVDFPIYAIHLNGISVTSVERLVDVVAVTDTISSAVTRLDGRIDSLDERVDEIEAHMPKHIDRTYEYTRIGINANVAYSATKNIAVSGYTPTGIKGYRILNNDTNGKNASWCVMPKLWIDGDSMEFTLWNQHQSQQAIVKVQIKVEYVSSNSV